MLDYGIGLIHHVGTRKKAEAGIYHDFMILPITDAFNDYQLGTDYDEFLIKPLMKGLQNISNKSRCSKSFDHFVISLKKFSTNSNLLNQLN